MLSLQVERDALNTWLEELEIIFDLVAMWRENLFKTLKSMTSRKLAPNC
jgi:hypothetical protein